MSLQHCLHVQTGVDAAGQPNIMAPPVSKLRKEFPLRPECMGNLVPQQINLWMGAASNGTSLCLLPQVQLQLCCAGFASCNLLLLVALCLLCGVCFLRNAGGRLRFRAAISCKQPVAQRLSILLLILLCCSFCLHVHSVKGGSKC